jgi:hypothetical protein
MKSTILVSGLLAIMLAGCTAAPVAEPTPTQTGSSAPLVATPAETVAATPEATDATPISVNEFLRSASPVLLKMGETWGDFGDFPIPAECARLQTEIAAIEADIKELSTPPQGEPFRQLMLESLDIQKAELGVANQMNSLAAEVKSGKRTKEGSKKEIDALVAASTKNVEDFNLHNKKLEAEIARLRAQNP